MYPVAGKGGWRQAKTSSGGARGDPCSPPCARVRLYQYSAVLGLYRGQLTPRRIKVLTCLYDSGYRQTMSIRAAKRLPVGT